MRGTALLLAAAAAASCIHVASAGEATHSVSEGVPALMSQRCVKYIDSEERLDLHLHHRRCNSRTILSIDPIWLLYFST